MYLLIVIINSLSKCLPVLGRILDLEVMMDSRQFSHTSLDLYVCCLLIWEKYVVYNVRECKLLDYKKRGCSFHGNSSTFSTARWIAYLFRGCHALPELLLEVL